ncbi:MAG: hypothetical protein KDA63_17050 [Planctomycetales bacterium]|nr:hypothetical protein [Planctomycetales bacterium]
MRDFVIAGMEPRHKWVPSRLLLVAVVASVCCASRCADAAGLRAGVAKVDVTNREAGPVNDPLFVKALVLKNDATTAVIVTVDAVAIAEIGSIPNEFLSNVRRRVEQSLGIAPESVIVNASHCHGIVCTDIEDRTVRAIEQAAQELVPVTVGVGQGHEDRIQENRRLILKDGRQVDVRQAYSLPPDEEVAAIGPIDPEIGVLRLDRADGGPLAVVYNFACHPIQAAASGGNTADITGFASQVIEDNTGAVALFLQGCGGDINPVMYKDVHFPRDAEPLGNRLGLSTLAAVREVQTTPDDRLTVVNEHLDLPRADLGARIIAVEADRERLVDSLQGTYLDLKTFLPLVTKYRLDPAHPSYESHRYLLDEALGRDDFARLDARNRRNIEQYIRNVHTMEQLTRINTNLALLRKHQQQNLAAGSRVLDVELVGLRVGDFVLTTFPGELTVQIGLNLKQASPQEHTFVAGYTNGYIYYAPTTEQLQNVGGAQEDSDCLLAPHWQGIYEAKAKEILGSL